MTAQEINHMVGVIRSLRGLNPESVVARRLELQAVGEMLLLLPLKTGGPEDILLPGYSKEAARAVLFGIALGRPRDSSMPWALKF